MKTNRTSHSITCSAHYDALLLLLDATSKSIESLEEKRARLIAVEAIEAAQRELSAKIILREALHTELLAYN